MTKPQRAMGPRWGWLALQRYAVEQSYALVSGVLLAKPRFRVAYVPERQDWGAHTESPCRQDSGSAIREEYLARDEVGVRLFSCGVCLLVGQQTPSEQEHVTAIDLLDLIGEADYLAR